MAEQQPASLYLQVTKQDVQSLVNKLTQFSQTLNPREQALLMERIKRSLPNAETGYGQALQATPEVFGAWLNSIIADGSRWAPE